MKIVKATVVAVLSVVMFAMTATAQMSEDVQKCFTMEGTTDYYFGEIDPNETVEHTFVFKNNCTETVEISQARASCGCTAAVISEKVVPPGGDAQINVKFTPPRGTRGKATKSVSIYLKGNDKPHTVIRISAKIKTDFEVHPQYIQLLGAEAGKQIKGTVSLKNVSGGVLNVKDVTLTMTTYADTSGTGRTIAIPLSAAKVTPSSFTLQKGESHDVTVHVTPQYKGQVNGAVRLKAGKNEGIIQVFGIVRASQSTSLRQPDGKSETLMLDSK